MNYPNYRLFDAIEYQKKKFPKSDMLNAKENGSWKHYSTATVEEIVNNFSVSEPSLFKVRTVISFRSPLIEKLIGSPPSDWCEIFI